MILDSLYPQYMIAHVVMSGQQPTGVKKMLLGFFTANGTREKIVEFKKELSSTIEDSHFGKKRNEYILKILSDIENNPSEWEHNTALSSDQIDEKLVTQLARKDMSQEGLDLIFSYLLSIFIEYNLHQTGLHRTDFDAIVIFASENIEFFSKKSLGRINYALRAMPLSVMRYVLSGENFANKNNVESFKQKIEKLKNEWDEEYEQRLEKVARLNDTLKEQEVAFNFIGLYKGFNDLSEAKRKEINYARIVMILLGFSIMVPFLVEGWMFFYGKVSVSSLTDLIKITPALSLTLVVIYFFRISLRNFESIKVQIIQIELRKSLCQFIQKYAEYSNEIKSKGHNPLGKFEEIIFSNIMPTQEKIPSTYDGLEQIASLISAVRGKGN